MKKRAVKINNLGFSLVELLIAMAILGVVSLTIYSFMMQGSRFYGKQYADADIQSEAQLVANTISDLIVDCEVNISYDNQISNSLNPADGSGVVYAEGKALEISNSDYQFVIFHNDSNLFYLERRPSASDPSVYEAYNIDNAELLAENITAFDVDLSRVSGKGKGKNIVTFTMTYESTGRSYSGNYQVNLRNDISVSGNSITPTGTEANCTALVVTPNPYYVDVRGKDTPSFYLQGTNSRLQNKDFMASSDAVNASRDNIYEWQVKDKDDNVVDYASTAGDTDEKIYHATFNHPESVPSYIQIIATSTIPNKATGVYPSDAAIVYFRKLIDMKIAPVSGVKENKVDPLGTAVFKPEYQQYNLNVADLRCSWVLEYKKGSGAYQVCNDPAYATVTMLDTAYSTTLKKRVATSLSVKLGEKADSNVKFRITAVNSYDSTFVDQYEFGVTKAADIEGVKDASRGVEIDLEAFFKNDGSKDWLEGMKIPLTDDIEIYKVYVENGVNYDAASGLYNVVERDGKWYVYLDFNAWANQSTPLSFYDSHQVQMKVFARSKSGTIYPEWSNSDHYNQTVNWYTTAVTLTSSTPLANTNIVIPKGGTFDVSALLKGYNISKKNVIGIYIQNGVNGTWENANGTEMGMVSVNPYISVEYTGGLGNRYILVDTIKFRLTAEAAVTDYPMHAIPMKVTLEPMYNLATFKDSDTHIERSSYTYNVYVANVEGTNAYIQGPPSVSDLSSWKVIIAADDTTKTISISEAEMPCTVNIVTPTAATVSFDAVKHNGQVSYYTMQYNNSTYYWNSTYNCWKRTSES